MNLSDELQKLQALHQSGAIDDHEFAQAKAKILDASSAAPAGPAALFDTFGGGAAKPEQQARQWAFLLHISVLAGLVVPLAGLIVPIVIWQLKKPTLPEIDVHGKIVMNWIISLIIYTIVGVLLVVVLIGIPILIALGVMSIVFPIMGAIKANNGEVWKYPLSIPIFK